MEDLSLVEVNCKVVVLQSIDYLFEAGSKAGVVRISGVEWSKYHYINCV